MDKSVDAKAEAERICSEIDRMMVVGTPTEAFLDKIVSLISVALQERDSVIERLVKMLLFCSESATEMHHRNRERYLSVHQTVDILLSDPAVQKFRKS